MCQAVGEVFLHVSICMDLNLCFGGRAQEQMSVEVQSCVSVSAAHSISLCLCVLESLSMTMCVCILIMCVQAWFCISVSVCYLWSTVFSSDRIPSFRVKAGNREIMVLPFHMPLKTAPRLCCSPDMLRTHTHTHFGVYYK